MLGIAHTSVRPIGIMMTSTVSDDCSILIDADARLEAGLLMRAGRTKAASATTRSTPRSDRATRDGEGPTARSRIVIGTTPRAAERATDRVAESGVAERAALRPLVISNAVAPDAPASQTVRDIVDDPEDVYTSPLREGSTWTPLGSGARSIRTMRSLSSALRRFPQSRGFTRSKNHAAALIATT